MLVSGLVAKDCRLWIPGREILAVTSWLENLGSEFLAKNFKFWPRAYELQDGCGCMAVDPQLKSAACGFLAGDSRPRHPDCKPVAAIAVC